QTRTGRQAYGGPQRLLSRAAAARLGTQPESHLGATVTEVEQDDAAQESVGRRVGNGEHCERIVRQPTGDDAVDLLPDDLRRVLGERQVPETADVRIPCARGESV